MNQWKFYRAIMSECKKRYKDWNSSILEVQEERFNEVYDELCNDEDIILDCLL